MANPIITALITDKVTQSSGADRITDSEVREVLNAINAFVADSFSYTTAIPFTCMKGTMAPHTVTAPITFTKNTTNAVPRASMSLRLTADGTNIPNFSAYKKQIGSQDWDNTASVVNVCLFWYDGVDYWYCIFQEDLGVVDGGVGTMIIGSSFIIG